MMKEYKGLDYPLLVLEQELTNCLNYVNISFGWGKYEDSLQWSNRATGLKKAIELLKQQP